MQGIVLLDCQHSSTCTGLEYLKCRNAMHIEAGAAANHPPAVRRASVKLPKPGPISRTASPFWTPAHARMSWMTFSETTKFCPRALRHSRTVVVGDIASAATSWRVAFAPFGMKIELSDVF